MKPRTQAELDAQSLADHYAKAMIRKDIERRHTGTEHHDFTTWGESINYYNVCAWRHAQEKNHGQ